MILTMTAGTGVIMWLGELITDRGVGNGMSVMIFTQIAATVPRRPVGHQGVPSRRQAGSSSCWCSPSDWS